MTSRLLVLFGVLTLLAACGPTYYHNTLNPTYGQSDFGVGG